VENLVGKTMPSSEDGFISVLYTLCLVLVAQITDFGSASYKTDTGGNYGEVTLVSER
jgi:hypothetical protein